MNQKKEQSERPRIPRELVQAEQLRLDRNYEEALKVCMEFLTDHFDFVPALTLAAHIFIDTGRFGLAHALMARAVQIAPDEAIIWNNLGICHDEVQRLDEAEKCFIKALARRSNDELAMSNLAHIYLRKGDPHKCIEYAEKANNLNPNIPEIMFNHGQANLMLRNWEVGWKGYEKNLGKHRGRRERVYGPIPRWTGVKGLTLIAYGEQGIGDEISFASCIPDLMKDNKVIIECDHRLESLFKRSFDVPVYGTRYKKDAIEWPLKHGVDATVAFGSLPGFYRPTTESFPGTPYLIADPERRLQWKALLASLGDKLKVGITWTGGIPKTMSAQRSVALSELDPILRQDATFISLQYKDVPEVDTLFEDTGIKVHHWPHAMQTQNYDDTAALVAELDLVITVQQSAVHIAGALGVPTWVLVPSAPLWRYGLTGTDFPWAKSVKLYRQKNRDWLHAISEVATDLRKLIASKTK